MNAISGKWGKAQGPEERDSGVHKGRILESYQDRSIDVVVGQCWAGPHLPCPKACGAVFSTVEETTQGQKKSDKLCS